jgi:hypothetical protein
MGWALKWALKDSPEKSLSEVYRYVVKWNTA